MHKKHFAKMQSSDESQVDLGWSSGTCTVRDGTLDLGMFMIPLDFHLSSKFLRIVFYTFIAVAVLDKKIKEKICWTY